MSELTPERWERVQTIFECAADLTDGARRSYLDEACDDDTALRREVESLLATDDGVDGFLARPARGVSDAPIPAPTGIDRYRILHQIGGGGMGEVYRAERADGTYEHHVAIKVLRRDLGGIKFARRFQRERQVLADLDHPGIARLLDGGTTDDDRPWLAMEYVDGLPIDRYCAEHDLDVDDRLRLVLRVGEAIEHAHRNLVIHRDIKPGNVLVTADGTPRVIDFGIALPLALGDAATMRTTGDEILGTIAYMSPEQCTRGAGAALDVRSDVYAIGVMLYELLTGHRPHDVRTLTLARAIEVITKEPVPRPSSLVPALRGDLDVILMKALEKDPDARYPSVHAFTADIERFLRSEPIEARPPGAVYVAGKFVRRHRTAAALTAAGVAALIATAAIAVTFAVRADRERSRADARTAEAEWNGYTGSLAAASGMTGIDPRSFRPEEAKRHLHAAPEHLRDWEWHHLDARRSRSLWEVGTRHHALSVAFDPNGSRVVVAQNINRAYLEMFDVRTGEAGWDFADGNEHKRPFHTVVWSPDGTRIATGSLDGTLLLWAPDATAPLASVAAHTKSLRGLAFAADGRRLLTAATDGGIAAWALEDDAPRLLWRATGAGGRPRRTLTFSPDGTRVVAGDDTGVLRLFDASTGTALAETAPPDARRIVCVRAADDRVIALDYRTRIITLDPHTLEITSSVTPDDRYSAAGGLTAAAISPSGRLVAREHYQFIAVLDTATGRVVAMTSGPREKAGISDLAFSPDERRLAVTCRDSHRLHMLSLPVLPAHWDIGSRAARTHAFDPTSTLLATGHRDGVVEIHHVASGIRVQRIAAHADVVHSLAFAGDGSVLVTAATEGVRWWDAESGRRLHAVTEYRGSYSSMSIDRTRTRLAFPTPENVVRIVDAVSGQLIIDLEPADGVMRGTTFSPDGARLAACSGGYVLVWDTRSGSLVRRLGPVKSAFDVAITPRGSVVACGYMRSVFEWPPGQDEAIEHRYRGRVWRVHALALNHAGTRLGTSGSDSHARVWSVDPLSEVVALLDRSAPQGAVSFSPDDRYFASTTTEEQAPTHVWCTDPAPTRLPAATVGYWHDRLDGDWGAIRSAVEADPWLLDADRAKALSIVDRLARFAPAWGAGKGPRLQQ